MNKKRAISAGLSAMVFALMSCATGNREAYRPSPDGPSLGGFVHRGERHELRDLMNPSYRAASNSEWVRAFSLGGGFAGSRGVIMGANWPTGFIIARGTTKSYVCTSVEPIKCTELKDLPSANRRIDTFSLDASLDIGSMQELSSHPFD